MSLTHPDGVAPTTRKAFSLSTRIAQHIDADAGTVWRLLTRVPEYPKWNSSVVSLDGDIAPGSTIKLVSKLDPIRT